MKAWLLILCISIYVNTNVFAEMNTTNLSTLDFNNLEFTLSKIKESPVTKQTTHKALFNNSGQSSVKVKYIPYYVPIKVPVYYPIYIPKYIVINK